MLLNILADFYWEAQVDKVLYKLSNYKNFFAEQQYGASLIGIVIVIVCQNPDLNLKRRVKFDKKEKMIYMDVMLDLPTFLKIDLKQRRRLS